MFGVWSRSWQLLASLALLIGTVSGAHAAGWSDDFNDRSVTDGSPVTWDNNPFGAFPGNYDASSGDYLLSNPNDGDSGSQLVTWVESVNFTDVYIRTQGVVMPGPLPGQIGGNLVLLGRVDAASLSTYVLYLDNGGTMVLQQILGGQSIDLAAVELGEINAASEVVMELNIIGNQLSGFAWRPGTSKPATPQITATDFILTTGKAGIAYDEDDDATIGAYRFVSAQDMPFMDALAGDYNGDGRVDAADYVVWRKGLLGGSFDQEDYNIWRQNFGASLGSGLGSVATVPEPAAFFPIAVAIVGVIGFATGRHRLHCG